MKLFRRFVNPLVAFIGIQLAWILVVVAWIYWFLGSHRQIRNLAEKYSPDRLPRGLDWIILAEGLVLLVVILGGVYVIFLYWKRQNALNREQKAFISQVTHELKSPLASLQLHLETIRLRHPTPQQLETFVGTMLDDTDRLHNLINKLLSSSRLEQKGLRLSLRAANLSAFVDDYFEKNLGQFPEDGHLDLQIEPNLYARIDTESLSMVLRNLVENAILYARGLPQVKLRLFADGSRCHLIFADKGRGIEDKDRKKVFRMFYRARPNGDKTHGSGLGLFIVRAVVLRHKGKVWLESGGTNRGTTFHILLPRIEALPEEDNQ